VRRRVGALAFALAVGACGQGEAPIRMLQPGDSAPAYAAPTMAGDTVALRELKGAVLVNVWATWCVPCREEMPALEALHEQWREEGLHVVAISIDEAAMGRDVAGFVEDHGITFTILRDPQQRVTRAFRTTGVPESFLFGRDGRLVQRWIGPFDPLSEASAEAIRTAVGDD
jgi:peroxiredoxin